MNNKTLPGIFIFLCILSSILYSADKFTEFLNSINVDTVKPIPVANNYLKIKSNKNTANFKQNSSVKLLSKKKYYFTELDLSKNNKKDIFEINLAKPIYLAQNFNENLERPFIKPKINFLRNQEYIENKSLYNSPSNTDYSKIDNSNSQQTNNKKLLASSPSSISNNKTTKNNSRLNFNNLMNKTVLLSIAGLFILTAAVLFIIKHFQIKDEIINLTKDSKLKAEDFYKKFFTDFQLKDSTENSIRNDHSINLNNLNSTKLNEIRELSKQMEQLKTKDNIVENQYYGKYAQVLKLADRGIHINEIAEITGFDKLEVSVVIGLEN